MVIKIIKNLLIVGYIQTVVYLFGFLNNVAKITGLDPFVDLTRLWHNFPGVVFWSVLSMLSVIGFTLALYLLVSRAIIPKANVGIIIMAIGFASPIIMSQFLLVPATLMILGMIFIRILITGRLPEQQEDKVEENKN